MPLAELSGVAIMNRDDPRLRFVFVVVTVPGRVVYYYADQVPGKWTGKLSDATFFPDKSSQAPLAELKFFQGQEFHKWVELLP